MYNMIIFKIKKTTGGSDPHVELGSYKYDNPPWVPREGEFMRFRDPSPPNSLGGRHPVNHTETAGRVKHVVTVVYGTSTTIEVYIDPR